jgi:hypothetical protein
MKKKKATQSKITTKDYIKAVKKADRDIQLKTSSGWTAITRVHKSKKMYNRNDNKNNYLNEI